MRSLFAIALVLVLGAASSLSAETIKDKKRAARAHFQQGEMHYKLGHFEQALEAYSKAYEALALPGFLFNIGQCHRKLGHWERAAFFYRGYLREKSDAPNRKVVEELIAECQAKQKKQQDSLQAEQERQRLEQVREQQERTLALEREKAEAEARAAAEARRAAEAQAVAEAARNRPPAPLPDAPAVYETWWFWTIIGVVVVGAAAGTAIALTSGTEEVLPSGSLGTIDWQAVRF